MQVREYSLCYTAVYCFAPLIAKESEAQTKTQQIAKEFDSNQQTFTCTKKLNDTFISRMYVNYYGDIICDSPHKPLPKNAHKEMTIL